MTNETNHEEISRYVYNNYTKINLGTKIRVHKPRNDLTIFVDILADLYDDKIITKDFMVVYGDLITEINYYNLLDFHFANRSTFTICKSPVEKQEVLKPFQNEDSSNRGVHVLEKHSDRLLGLIDSFDLGDKGIQLKPSILCRHPNIYFNSNLEEKGVLVCNFAVCQLLAKISSKFESFTEEFLSFITKNQYNLALRNLMNQQPVQSETRLRVQERALRQDDDFMRPFLYVSNEFSM